MKNLAIAAFVLGIIGFLCSFISGLGLLPGVLAVVFGLISLRNRSSRPVATSGLVLGLLGVPISVYFLVQNPADLIEATLEEITQEDKTKLSQPVITLGETIKLGEVLIAFDSVSTTATYDTGQYPRLLPSEETIKETAKPNYKLVSVKASGRNIGKQQDGLWCRVSDHQEYELEVDKGYLYKPLMRESILNICLQPEEVGSGELVFEILESAMPTKLHALINGQRFTVNLL